LCCQARNAAITATTRLPIDTPTAPPEERPSPLELVVEPADELGVSVVEEGLLSAVVVAPAVEVAVIDEDADVIVWNVEIAEDEARLDVEGAAVDDVDPAAAAADADASTDSAQSTLNCEMEAFL